MRETQTERIAVCIPCYNEEATVERVVHDFRAALPGADIYVIDNNSSDATVESARKAKAIVKTEPRQGKGNVVRTMFRGVDADIYIMVDGDDTYPADSANALIEPVRKGTADLVVGARMGSFDQKAFRKFHLLGNGLVVWLINTLFASKLTDVLSGYRVFSKSFAKTVPIMSSGFEVETEMTISALDKGFRILEIPIEYGVRPRGSVSKLNTYRDGVLIIRTILRIFKDYRPLLFFGVLGMLLVAASLAVGFPVLFEFSRTGLINKVPSAILAIGLGLLGMLQIGVGLILDSQAWLQRENYQNFRTFFEFIDRGQRGD